MTRDELESVGAVRDAVRVGWECPTCGNAEIDALAWVDANGINDCGELEAATYEHVRCCECGTSYMPGNN